MIDTKALREKVLDLAIRGKLVPQDPNDEPASVLLERIRAEKEQMVKDGKLKAKDIKKDTIIFKGDDNLHYEQFPDGTVKCIEDEIPFDVPNGWSWCRLRNLFNVCSAKRVLQSEWRKEGVPFYRAREIVKLSNSGYVDNDLFISEEHYQSLKQSYGVPQAGDLMVTGVGTIGKVYIVKKDDLFYYKDASVLCFENRYGIILSEYARIMIDSPLLQNQIHSKTYGNTVDTITISTANEYICLLPPIKEQLKIINAVNSSIELIAAIEHNKSELSDIIVQAKSKILDLAIRGKLVPQNPDDEPAAVLLERIRAEKEELIKQGKIKRNKKESVIFKGEDNSYYEVICDNMICIDDVLPYCLPIGWTWCRLKSLAALCDNSFVDGPFGSNLKSEHYTTKKEVRIIQLNNIGELIWKNNGVKYTTFDHAKKIKRCLSYPGDIVIAKMMPAGRAVIIPSDIDKSFVISSDCVRLQLYEQIYNQYIMYMINSKTINSAVSGDTHGIGRSRTSLSKLKDIIIPLPPLAEQKRIVAAIEIAFSQLDEILNSIS